jgi:hypothetical protein
MVDDKDRFGDKLRQKEKAEEDRFFAERDKAMLEKLRQQVSATELERIRELSRMRCPKCGDRLVAVEHHGVTVEECPSCHGMWLDPGELEMVARRERDSWLGRFFHRPGR